MITLAAVLLFVLNLAACMHSAYRLGYTKGYQRGKLIAFIEELDRIKNVSYRDLEAGEIILPYDEIGDCTNPMKDQPNWIPVPDHLIGTPAPNPRYPAHTRYRRPY
jgi:hypothetical protein